MDTNGALDQQVQIQEAMGIWVSILPKPLIFVGATH
jgi:hypothetical protein